MTLEQLIRSISASRDTAGQPLIAPPPTKNTHVEPPPTVTGSILRSRTRTVRNV